MIDDKSNRRTLLLASLAADSLALGAHWIYDTAKIEAKFGRVDTFLTPEAKSFHHTKKRGEFTHYGDQTFILLESIAAKKGFDLDDFASRWRAFSKDYEGYCDQATKATLKNFDRGKSPLETGSSSNDLAGAARIAPLFLCHQENLDTMRHLLSAPLLGELPHISPFCPRAASQHLDLNALYSK